MKSAEELLREITRGNQEFRERSSVIALRASLAIKEADGDELNKLSRTAFEIVGELPIEGEESGAGTVEDGNVDGTAGDESVAGSTENVSSESGSGESQSSP